MDQKWAKQLVAQWLNKDKISSLDFFNFGENNDNDVSKFLYLFTKLQLMR